MEEAKYTMNEVHKKVCETHIGGRTLASKIARAGYYWPTLGRDCTEFVNATSANGLQIYTKHHLSRYTLSHDHGHSICRNPFSQVIEQVKFLVVVVNYFTKWVEAEPIATIFDRANQAILLEKDNLSFQPPYCHTTLYLDQTPIDKRLGRVSELLRGLRQRLEEAKGRWVEELSTNVVISIEIGELSPKTTFFRPIQNEEEMKVKFDLLQEVQEVAHIKEYSNKARATQQYNTREGPDQIIEEIGKGAYRLEHLDERKVPRPWNTTSLRIYYS
ncbi:hypothetical protein CR513_58165, partial [Mucuna pruriens]